MKRTVTTAFILAVALAAPVLAGNFQRYPMPYGASVTAAAGLVSNDGRVILGTGFTARKMQVGQYEVTFNRNFFSACAAMVVNTTYTNAVATVGQHACHPSAIFRVFLYQNGSGQPVDADFHFIAVQE